MSDTISESDEHLERTRVAQAVIRGEAEPPLPLAVDLGAPLDLVDGTIRCPACSFDNVELIEALSFPAGGYPQHGAFFMRCRSCKGDFAIHVDVEGAGLRLRTTRPR